MNIYGLLKMGLDASNLRGETISQNIANINTPDYKRKVVTFEETLKANSKSSPTISVEVDNSSAMRSDGNNVDLEVEKINQAANSLQFNAMVTLVNAKLSLTNSVIRGQ